MNNNETLKSTDVFNAELASEMVKRTNKLSDSSIDLALRVKDARDFIAWHTEHMRTAWLNWYDESNTILQNITQSRMAFDREAKHLAATAKDIQLLFSDPIYCACLQKLKDTVKLLDRFKDLKSNGTLDAFADFILKLQA